MPGKLRGRGAVAGRIGLNDETRDLAGPIHLPLQVVQEHEHRAVFVDAETVEQADDVKRLRIDVDDVAHVLAEIGGQNPTQHDAVLIARLQVAGRRSPGRGRGPGNRVPSR